jgi:trimethylamine--corrinoid protein Co-methyltransferase
VGAHSLIAALAGARAFRTAGLLSCGEIYSGEMLVVINEILNYLKATLKEEKFSEERLMMDEIRAVGPGQSHIGRKSTFDNFRKEYWEPALFLHSNLGQWKEMGSKSIWQYTGDMVKKTIKAHTYTAGDDVLKELDKIYKRAREDKQLEESFKVVR